MNKWISAIVVLVIVAGGWWYYTNNAVPVDTADTTLQDDGTMSGEEPVVSEYISHDYTCSHDARLSLVTNGDPSTMGVSFSTSAGDYMENTLPIVEAASGAKYEGYGVVVWNKGEETTVTYRGMTYMCRLEAPAPAGTDASDGIDVSATVDVTE